MRFKYKSDVNWLFLNLPDSLEWCGTVYSGNRRWYYLINMIGIIRATNSSESVIL